VINKSTRPAQNTNKTPPLVNLKTLKIAVCFDKKHQHFIEKFRPISVSALTEHRTHWLVIVVQQSKQ
jgi:hypothetical protein